MTTVHLLPIAGSDLHHRFPRESLAQRCHVTLDCRSGALTAEVDMEIGVGIPADVYREHIQRWTIPALKATVANNLLAEIQPIAQRVVDGYSSKLDNGNYVARFTEDAGEAIGQIEQVCGLVGGEGAELNVWGADDFFRPLGSKVEQAKDLHITSTTSDEKLTEVGQSVMADAKSNGIDEIDGLDDYLIGLRQAMRDAPALMLEKLYDEVGWVWDADDLKKPVSTILDVALDGYLVRGSEVWVKAHHHLVAAGDALVLLDRETALRELRAADSIAEGFQVAA